MELYLSPKGDDRSKGSLRDPIRNFSEAIHRLEIEPVRNSECASAKLIFAPGQYCLDVPILFRTERLRHWHSIECIGTGSNQPSVIHGGTQVRPDKDGDLFKTHWPRFPGGVFQDRNWFENTSFPNLRVNPLGLPLLNRPFTAHRDEHLLLLSGAFPYHMNSDGETLATVIGPWDIRQKTVKKFSEDGRSCELVHTKLPGRETSTFFDPAFVFFRNVPFTRSTSPEWRFNKKAKILSFSEIQHENLPIIGQRKTLIYISGHRTDTEFKFINLHFRYTGAPIFNGDYRGIHNGLYYDVDGVPERHCAAIEIQVPSVHFEKCDFAALSGTGIRFSSGALGCRVTQCRFENIGVNAIEVINDLDTSFDSPRGYAITFCDFKNLGLSLSGGNALQIERSSEIEFAFNRVNETPGPAVVLNNGWNVGPSRFGGHRIHHNELFNTMKLYLDGGAIYIVGDQNETDIYNNLVDTVGCLSSQSQKHLYTVNGIFLDELTKNLTLRNNEIRNSVGKPLRIHRTMSAWNKIENVPSNDVYLDKTDSVVGFYSI